MPTITERLSVAILSKRTTEGIFNPVPRTGTMGAIPGPVRNTEVMKQTTTSNRLSLSHDKTSAGRRLSPDKSVNGKRARTMLPNANTYPACLTRSVLV